jgi:hypothetical protein
MAGVNCVHHLRSGPIGFFLKASMAYPKSNAKMNPGFRLTVCLTSFPSLPAIPFSLARSVWRSQLFRGDVMTSADLVRHLETTAETSTSWLCRRGLKQRHHEKRSRNR